MKRLIKRWIIWLAEKVGLFRLLTCMAALLPENGGTALSEQEALGRLNEFSSDCRASAYRAARDTENPICDLDIIVPCYNVEKTVRKCLDSILNQKTVYSFRVIVVDDGSVDMTSRIVEEYKTYPEVLVIHQENKGFSGARNAGLEVSRSRYVMFVDSDDFIPFDAVEKLMSRAMENDAALVEGGYAIVDENGGIIRNFSDPSGPVNPTQAGMLKGYACAKVIKNSVLRDIQFPEGYWFEDTVVRAIICERLAQLKLMAYCIPDCVYYYYAVNLLNISHTSVRKPKCIDTFYITVAMFNDREKFGFTNNQDYYEHILCQIRLNYMRTRFMPTEIQKAMFAATRHFFVSNFGNLHTEIKQLKYLEKALRENKFALYKTAARLMR